MHGQFSWYDLMTPDAGPAKKFYPAVAGWGIEEWDKGEYTMWTAGGVPFAGINPISPEQAAQGIPPHWLAYVTVDDVERSAAKVTALGGRVMHGPEDIPDVGRFAIIEDPQGAMLAIFKSSTPSPGFDGTPSLGKFSWHELMTTDYQAALDFYRQLFGWEKIEEIDMGPIGKYLEYGMKGKMFGGILNRRPEHGNMPPNWTFYANVKDLDKAVAAVKKNGGAIKMAPMDVPGGSRVAVASDPQGAMFALHQSPAASAPRPKAKVKAKARPKAKAKGKTARKVARKKSAARASKKATSKKKPRRSKAASRRPKAKAKRKGRRR